jgi:hypothetical protein
MKTLFTEAELIECVRKPVPRPDWFQVLAYYRPQKRWSLRKGLYKTQEAAEKAVSKLAAGWEPVRIVRIPGEE